MKKQRFKQRRKKFNRQNRAMLAIERVLGTVPTEVLGVLTAKNLADAFEKASNETLRVARVYLTQQEWDDISKDRSYVASF